MIQSTAPQWPMAQWPTLCEDGVVCACVMMEWFAADVKVELLAILSRRFFFDSNFAFRSHAHPEIPFRRFDQQPLPPTPDNDYEVAPTELEFHHELWKFSSNHGYFIYFPKTQNVSLYYPRDIQKQIIIYRMPTAMWASLPQ